MKKSWSKSFSVMIIAMMIFSLLAACTQSKDKSTAPTASTDTNATATPAAAPAATETPKAALDPVTVNLMLWGDKPKQFDEMIAEFQKETKDTLNMTLNVSFTPLADYGNKLKLKIAGGEQVDLAFDAPWLTMPGLIASESYFNLDKYFNNDQYPGLKKAFSDNLLNNNKFTGPDKQNHIYGVPLGQAFGAIGGVFYRKDLAAKYGMGDIQTMDDYLKYLDNIKKNEPNMIPYVFAPTEYPVGSAADDRNLGVVKAKAGIYDVPLGNNNTATVYLKDKKVVSVYVKGEPLSALSNFPDPFNKPDYFNDLKAREWNQKGYIEKNAVNRKDQKEQFTAGKAASYAQTADNFASILSQLKGSVPSAELGLFIVNADIRNQKPEAELTDYKFWNFLSIPASSKNADRTMMFLDWLFGDKAHHDLFELGIQGKNWEPAGDNKYKVPAGVDIGQNYAFPGYQLTWNPNYFNVSNEIPDVIANLMTKYNTDEKTYLKAATAGFSFNGEVVKSQLNSPSFVKIRTDDLSFTLGLFPDVMAQRAKVQAAWEKDKKLQEDIQTIKKEVTTQLQAFLDAQK